jgi:hypothetical protein
MNEAISQDREKCQFPFCLMKNLLSYRSARPESGRGVRKVFLLRRALEVRASGAVGLR